MSTSYSDLPIRTLPFFDETLYNESIPLYSTLSLENYCTHATQLLNGPSIRDCIGITGAVRSVVNSISVYAVSQDGLVSLSLFYLVSLCEGILMPHLQPLITLCEQQGYKGPLSKGGKYAELEAAKSDFGPAIKFLATHGQPIFSPGSLGIGNRLKEYERDRLSKLRNSIAHLNFRLEIVRTDIKDQPEFPKDPKQAAVIEALYKGFVKSLHVHNPHEGQIVDMANSIVRWEGSLGKPVTKLSSAASFKDIRDTVGQVEAFAFSLSFAFLEAGEHFGSALVIGVCKTCKEGHVVFAASETHATCPACGTTHPVQPPSDK